MLRNQRLFRINWGLSKIVLIGFIALIFFILLWRRRRKQVLENKPTSRDPFLRQLVVEKTRDSLFSTPGFLRTIQDLRRHKDVDTQELDGDRTIRATVNKGGLFTPVYGTRQTAP